ncbi:sarcosine oxidase subunit gamma [Pseudoroseicyclus aestuarii]|uniref:Heterotetrameric sarcosine oxidase gamma subunit n=1 Tax=Pseudoroseicyclus aestuarii TaxID=1795041 RepID=A0A318SQG2_9RHOB|nr:sarcosine oxidase subunit gamma family protein [Pseudoroseicyclus aestuarii]PYE84121.1 heterotetrameric sarcosine oxidase gamma subunit [Pseudoroseicyclus aestuarii]
MAEITVTRRTPGMVLLRGDLSSDALREAASAVAGAPMPERRQASLSGDTGILWMSPDEALILLPEGRAAEAARALSQRLEGVHHLALDLSDARAVFEIEGPWLREVLAKLSPADLHPEALPLLEVRRTRLAQVPAAFWIEAEGRARLICFRSVADYVEGLLRRSVEDGPVGLFA